MDRTWLDYLMLFFVSLLFVVCALIAIMAGDLVPERLHAPTTVGFATAAVILFGFIVTQGD
jgi:multisubunit Na+/H+ antiporter MnhG subunit